MPSAAELSELDDEELDARLVEYRRELLNLRFQLATGQLDNVTRVGQVRRDVARALTVLRDREIALAEGHPIAPTPPAVRRPRPVVEDTAPEEPTDEAPAGPDDDEVDEEEEQ